MEQLSHTMQLVLDNERLHAELVKHQMQVDELEAANAALYGLICDLAVALRQESGGRHVSLLSEVEGMARSGLPARDIVSRLLALEASDAFPLSGTSLTRVLMPGKGNGLGWTLAIGGLQQPKLFYTARSIPETVAMAENALINGPVAAAA